MRLNKKISYLEGDGYWLLKGSRLRLSDGPHGLRKEAPRGTLQATCFPTASALACSWDEKLVELVGESLATECIAQDVDMLLGPGVNLQRHPGCGRNFEYFGEDPLLSGKMAAAYIRGVQSKNVAATLKHFALNSQETDRFLAESVVDERALRELYLMPFEIAIRESNPWAVMTAYNRFEGLNAGENKRLLDILRSEWSYDGCVVSDWGSVENRVLGLEAGMDLEMPGGSSPSSAEIKKGYRKGQLDEELIDRALTNIEKLEDRAGAMKRSARLGHYRVAVDAARECMVLLKNDGDLLPLAATDTILLAGAIDEAQIQGLGSSRVEPLVTNTPLRQWRDGEYPYILDPRQEGAEEFEKKSKVISGQAEERAADVGAGLTVTESDNDRKAGICLYFAKLSPDAEGYDRLSLELSPEDKMAVDRLKNKGYAIVLILQTGAPIALGDVRADAVLLMNYAGEGAYEALQSLIYGLHSPSGRLCATWTEKQEDIASDPYYPAQDFLAQYRESIYVGYRYHVTFDKPVAYPFGYGLTYGKFRYEQIEAELTAGDVFLNVRVTNIGKRKAKEVVQAYVSFPTSSLLRPFYELKAWAKVELEAGESRDIVLKIPHDRLKTYTPQGEKIFEDGVYYFLCGPNCRDLPLIASLELHGNGQSDRMTGDSGTVTIEHLRQRHLLFSGLDTSSKIPAIYKTMDRPVSQIEFEQLLGRKVPESVALQGVHAPLCAIRGPLRPLFLKIASKRADAMPGDRQMNRRAVLSMPLRALARLSEGLLSPRLLKFIVFFCLRGPHRSKRIRRTEAQKHV